MDLTPAAREWLRFFVGCAAILLIVSGIVLCMLQPFSAIW